MDKVRWLLVGAGEIARKRVAAALAEARNSEIAAICDINPQAAENLASAHGAACVYSDLNQALEHSRTDAAYIATPVAFHVEQTCQALAAGKHVLVEKPLGLTAADCARAIATAEASGKWASCAYYRRFYPRYLHAAEMLERGEFGQVVAVRMTYFSWFAPAPDDPKHWRVMRVKSGGGPLSDMGTHMFDVLIGLLGMPVRVYARCANLIHAWEVEDSAAVIMELANGALACASFNWNSKTWRHEFEIVGTEAKVNWLPYDSGPVTKTVGRDTETLDLPCAENVHLPMVEDFVSAVLEQRPPRSSLPEAAKTNVLLDAIYRSSAENREVKP